MNWVLIIVLTVLGLGMFYGYRMGLLRMIYSMAAWILVLVFVSWATPHVTDFLLNETALYDKIHARCMESVRQTANEQTEKELGGRETEMEALGLKLPDSVIENILNKTADAADGFLETGGIYTQIADEMAGFVIQGLAFFISMLAAWIAVHLISQLLGIVSRIPVLKGINRFFGLFAGGIYGLILVWIAFYIVALCSTGGTGRVLLSYIYDSTFLRMLYENNPILAVVLLCL